MTEHFEGSKMKKWTQRREEEIEADIVVATCGNRQWGVVSLSGGSRRDGKPMIVYSGLESEEAAHAARSEVLAQAIEDGHVYGPSEVPIEHFNSIGRTSRKLGDAE